MPNIYISIEVPNSDMHKLMAAEFVSHVVASSLTLKQIEERRNKFLHIKLENLQGGCWSYIIVGGIHHCIFSLVDSK